MKRDKEQREQALIIVMRKRWPSDQNHLTCSLDPFRCSALQTLKWMLVEKKKKRGIACTETTTTHWYMTHAGHEIKRCRSQNQAPQASGQA